MGGGGQEVSQEDGLDQRRDGEEATALVTVQVRFSM